VELVWWMRDGEGGRSRLISKRGRAAAWKINSKSALESGARTSTLFCSGNVNFETHK
jgi:hypothetical protein